MRAYGEDLMRYTGEWSRASEMLPLYQYAVPWEKPKILGLAAQDAVFLGIVFVLWLVLCLKWEVLKK